MKYIFLIAIQSFICSLVIGQDAPKAFPANVDLENFKNCQFPKDTLSLQDSITNRDFKFEKLSYDYSKFEYVDINQDGQCEIFHYFSSGVRGWPHDFLTVYDFINGKLTKIFDGSSYFATFAESDGNYLQINYIGFDGHKTNPIYKNTVWKFDGKKYSPYYSSDLTKGEMKSKGLKHYRNNKYELALLYFRNVLIIPHTSDDELLSSANDVAITLIKMDRANQVEDFLEPYISKANDKKILASSYFNMGLAKELTNQLKQAKIYFKKSNQLNQTKASTQKIKKYER